jgi:ABC-type transport system substrate-binding protein
MRRFASAALLVLAACGGETGDRSTLNYYFTSDPRSLDPALSTDVPTGETITLIFDNLTRFDVDANLEPGLAERWDVDSAGLVYTFHLRPNVTFHDGRLVVAEDVRASFLRVLDPRATGGRNWPLMPIVGAREYAAGNAEDVRGIRVLDDSTVQLEITEPLNLFPKLLAMPVAAIVPTPTPAGFDQQPIGSGPWRFVSWAHDDAIVLSANENYWGGRPAEDTLIIRIIPEPLTQAAEFEAGNLSVVEVPFGETRRWEETQSDLLQRRPALRDLYIAINTTRGPLADVRVRRALNHAVDVETILRTVMGGRGVRAAGAIPPGIEGYDSTRAPYRHDPELAKRLLAEAGYPNGFDLQLWRTQRSELARIAQAVQSDLGEVGIRVEIVERDASSAREAARAGETDMFISDWYADYPDPENFTYPLFHSRNVGPGGNMAFLRVPAIDSMIMEMRSTPDSMRKIQLARAVDQAIFEQAPWIFLWFPVDMWAVRPEIEGWKIYAVFTGQRWVDVRYE